MVEGENELHILEYIIFGGLLLVSLSVGFFFAWKERNQSADSYLLNNDAMNPYAAGLSIFVSLVSALTVIGLPVEVYQHGDGMTWRVLGGFIGTSVLSVTFVPLFHKLRIYSVYTYLERRFNSNKMVIGLSLFLGIIGMTFHMMALSYLTALSLSTVTHMSVPMSLIMLSTIAILYTMMGGMKAVIWTDVLQSGVLVFSLLAVTVKLWSDLGAEKIIFDVKAANAHRIWDVLDLDPTKRSSSAWIVGEISLMFFNVGTGQYFVQRYVSCATVKDAQKSIWIGGFVSLLVGGCLIPMIGMASISYFAGCDPVLNGELGRHDALMPLLVTRIFKTVPGMTGLFISAAYSATLSTLSTGLNGMATIMFKSIIPGRVKTDKNLIRCMRLFIIVFGAFITLGALMFSIVPGTVIGLTMLVLGSFSAPYVMIFLLGIYTTRTHPKGIIVGTFTSQIILALKVVGMLWYPAPAEINDLTWRNGTMCEGGDFSPAVFIQEDLAHPSFDVPDPYPSWHKIFWVSNVGWTSFYACLLMAIPCYVVSIYTKDTSGYIPDPDLHLSLFSGSIWPAGLRNYFMLEIHRRHNSERKMTLDQLLLEDKDEALKT